jgi:hypothetical protein
MDFLFYIPFFCTAAAEVTEILNISFVTYEARFDAHFEAQYKARYGRQTWLADLAVRLGRSDLAVRLVCP